MNSTPHYFVDIRLCKTDSTYRTLSITVGRGIIDAFFAENVRTGFENYLSLAVGCAYAHNF